MPSEIIMTGKAGLDGEWQSGNDLLWHFHRNTLVTGFAADGEINGLTRSVRFDNVEMLMAAIPTKNVIFPGIDLQFPIIHPGGQLRIILSGFKGRFRPVGIQEE